VDLARCVAAVVLSTAGETSLGHVEIRPNDASRDTVADGTGVAFTGFPFEARRPLTARGHIAMRLSPDTLILDRAACGPDPIQWTG
jgi:hypothetical protein